MNRDFKGVWIPKSIYLNKELSWTEKILLIEIDSLDNDKEKGCFASNKYLGEFLNKSPGYMKNVISKLRKMGYIEQIFFDGRNRGLRVAKGKKTGKKLPPEPAQKCDSRLHKNVTAEAQKCDSRLHKNVNIIIQSNNTENNTGREKTPKLPKTSPDTTKNEIQIQRKFKDELGHNCGQIFIQYCYTTDEYLSKERSRIFYTWLRYRASRRSHVNDRTAFLKIMQDFQKKSVHRLNAAIDYSMKGNYPALYFDNPKVIEEANRLHNAENKSA